MKAKWEARRGDKYLRFAKSERSRVFRPNSAYDRLGAKGQKSVNLVKAVLTRECINIVAKRLQDSGKMTWLRLASSQTRMGFQPSSIRNGVSDKGHQIRSA